jgi:hypothetical protein
LNFLVVCIFKSSCFKQSIYSQISIFCHIGKFLCVTHSKVSLNLSCHLLCIIVRCVIICELCFRAIVCVSDHRYWVSSVGRHNNNAKKIGQKSGLVDSKQDSLLKGRGFSNLVSSNTRWKWCHNHAISFNVPNPVSDDPKNEEFFHFFAGKLACLLHT